MLIALAAGGVGIGLAHVLLRGLVLVTRGREVLFTLAVIDEPLLSFTLMVSLPAPLFFGLLPALGAVRANLNDALREGDRAGAGRKSGRTRSVRVGLDASAPWRQIVGVVENVASGNDIQNLNVPQVYVPASQAPRSTMVLLARANGNEAALTGAIREEVWAIDPQQPIDDVRTMNDYLYDLNSVGFAMITMFVIFALFALAMAGMGLYGVMSFMVSQRSREIGLRMALGAERAPVLRLVLGQGGKLLLFGTTIGLVIAFLLSRMVASLLFGISSTDPVSFIGVPLVLILIALAANFIPAQRATRIDPMRTLRSE